jgi:hypothetical protein
MKPNITILVIVLSIILPQLAYSEEASISTYPSPPSESNMQTVTGSLTEASAALNSPFGKHVGNQTRVDPTPIPPTLEYRCQNFTVQVKASIDDSDVELAVSWLSSTIFTPAWVNRTSHCLSATAEWNAFYNRVRNHELGHHETTANYCVESIIIPGYFTGVDFNAESPWYGILQTSEAVLSAQNQLMTKCVIQANLISDYISGPLVEQYHSQVGATTTRPNANAECN